MRGQNISLFVETESPLDNEKRGMQKGEEMDREKKIVRDNIDENGNRRQSPALVVDKALFNKNAICTPY